MRSPLAIYLRNHEAAAQGGRDLFRRVAAQQRSRPYGGELAELAIEVDEDLRRLQALMSEVGVRPDPALGTLMRVGERFARLKPNGGILLRAPLTDLIEIEALLDAVRAKWAGWHALLAAGDQQLDTTSLAALKSRADDQIERLVVLHADVAARILTMAGPD